MKHGQLFFLIFLFNLESLWASSATYGMKVGYILDVAVERTNRVYEIQLVSEPFPEEVELKKMFFVPRLNKEFKERFEQTFGFTDIERNISAPNQYAEQEYQPGVWVTPEEDQLRREAFGNYMVKRLTEHHVDEYVKSNPAVRPVYELKERVSNVKLEVKKGYRVNIRYNFSGNFLNVKVDNPYDIESRLTLQMNPEQVGPSEILETRLYLGYEINREIAVSTDYAFYDGDLILIGSRNMGNNVSVTLTGSADLKESQRNLIQNALLTNRQLDIEGEKRLLLGLTWTN